MSGLASIVLSAIALFYPDIFNANGKYIFGSAALLCAVLAGFFVWRKTSPELRIEVQNCLITKPEGNHFARVDTNFVIFHICITNLNPNPNSIKSYELFIDIYDQKVEAESTYTETYYIVYGVTKEMVDLIENRAEITITQGQYKNGWLCFVIPTDKEVKGCPFILTVKDSYNVIHKVKGHLPLDYETNLIQSKPAMDNYMNNFRNSNLHF